jgi:hypothetical protein
MKLVSACFLGLQAILFILLTIAVVWMYVEIVMAGGGFDARFASTQFSRLVAFLAPYLALPVSIVLTLIFYKNGKHRRAIWLPLALIAITFVAGQSYLKVVPDPIQENFGARSEPYPGFLVLPEDAVPEGFKEVKHWYSKRQYTISFTKMVDGKKIDLDISEGDHIRFIHSGSELVQEFDYQGITGQVYIHHHKRTLVTSYKLIWAQSAQTEDCDLSDTDAQQ